ncbi:nucleoside hydrolase [Novosphingobium sp. Fuku2-ISO-50]|uniref:nucleoside hydrolase n=1 Tax=Novosphingobium sp. Fuku2-ISO-50 TaxID=1739114 RepID=UPI00076C1241|nr:nucleoside hydrolase [Novosphingobium sp. Fuku2-ISO-50]KUR79668.1 nucleoside hydrolase [Novosphingobium sp. Fuku2-ISO-50]
MRLSQLPLLTLSLLAGLLALALPQTADAADKRKVIIDDDGFSMMQVMLLKSGDVDVLGLTSVSGDLWANRAAAQALRGLELLGRTDVPVAQGATFPLVNSEAATDRWETLYGKLTWRGVWMRHWVEPTLQPEPAYHGPNDPVTDLAYGNPTTHAIAESAAQFLIRMVHKYPGEITIVACGPMTNLALAEKLDPDFAHLVKALVYMGGSLNPHQALNNRSAADFAREFANSPRREFNFRFDPEAASLVSRSPWRAITMIPVDPSTATQMSPDLIARLEAAAPAPFKPWVHQLPANWPLWDEIAAAVWLDPSLVTAHDRLYIDVSTQFGPGYGDTLSWSEHYQPGLGEQSADVVRSVDAGRLYALMVNSFSR